MLHQIGAGTLGPVFRAYDPDQDRLVAVKLFRLDLAPERVHQLVAGLQRLIDADLAHPAVAAPLAAGIAGASAYLAQDFVAADSLDIVMREFGPTRAADASRVATQLAGAIDFAATAGVHHGALHPRDVLLVSDDARLTGFGVARVLDELGVGTSMRRPYTAPERLAGQPWDRRADVFSLAMMIAEMIAGRRLAGMGARAVEGLPESDGADMTALRAVLAKAMAELPDGRFQTASAFADELKRAADRPNADVPASALKLDPPPDRRLDPLLPLEDPGQSAAEARLPGDAPIEPDADDTVWDPSLSPMQEHSDVPDPAIDRPSSGPPAPLDQWSLLPATPADLVEPELPELSDKPMADKPGPVERGRSVPSGDARPAPLQAAAPSSDKPYRPAAEPTGRVASERDVSQSAVWPITLALMVGLIVGVAVGFFVFGDRAGRGATSEAETAASSPPPPIVAAPEAGNPERVKLEPPAAAPSEAPAPATPQPAPAAAVPRPSPAPPAPAPARATEAAAGRGTTAASGRLLVRLSPAGARVFLDGQDVGATPVTLRALSFGGHNLRLAREGYESEERRVIISAAQPAQSLIVDLVRVRAASAPAEAGNARFSAPLIVESRPPGAAVFLNGRRVGTTPLTMDVVPAGSHVLRLELDGYRRWTSSVRVTAGERNRVTASLEQ